MGKSLTRRYLENQRRAEMKDKADDLVLKRWEEFCRDADISILYTLHEVFGFGKERLERFYRGWIKNHTDMIKKYRCDNDDSHYWVMEARLKDIGVDIDALLKEAEEL